MAQEITITQSDLDKIQSTEKMTKAILIIVSVGAGLMILISLAGMLRSIAAPRGLNSIQPNDTMQRRMYRGGQQGNQGLQTVPGTQTPQQGQTQGSTDSVDINSL